MVRGAIAGLCGGVAMALAMMVLSVAVKQSPWQMAKRLAGVFWLTHEFWMTGLAYALTLWVINFWDAQITPGGRETSGEQWAWLSPLAHVVAMRGG